MKKAIGVVIALLVAGAVGWFIGRARVEEPASGEKKVAFYQSSMHPWIRSDKPGNCTICGMKLTPVYEGEQGFGTGGDLVTLSSNAIQVLSVATEVAARRPLTRTLRVAGRIEADETRYRIISAYVGGRIEELLINFTGAEVEKGQPLARLYSPELQTAQREYLAVLAQTNLADSPQMAAEHERLVQAAKSRLTRFGLSDEQIGSMKNDTNGLYTTLITAPISGTVVKRDVAQGQYVQEGDRLLDIADLSVMWFRFEVYEQDLPLISLGQSVEVTSPALGNRSFRGPITFIEPTLNEATRSARVRVELQNPVEGTGESARRLLYNGLYADGRIQIESEPVLAVTESAVLHPGDQPRVYVDQGGGAYELRVVELGRKGDRFWEVRKGIQEGESVVTSGNLMIDSQAQIDRTGSLHSHQPHAPGAPTESEATKLHSVTIEQARRWIDYASDLSAALAADSLEQFNELVNRRAAEDDGNPPARPEENASTTSALQQLRNLQPARSESLDAARRQFAPFSGAVAKLVQDLRAHTTDLEAKVFRCPMYPKMGQNAFWVQREGPLRNPFYGAEMIECGVEAR